MYLNSQISCFSSKQYNVQLPVSIFYNLYPSPTVEDQAALNYFTTHPLITSIVIFIMSESAVYGMLSQLSKPRYQFQPSERKSNLTFGTTLLISLIQWIPKNSIIYVRATSVLSISLLIIHNSNNSDSHPSCDFFLLFYLVKTLRLWALAHRPLAHQTSTLLISCNCILHL